METIVPESELRIAFRTISEDAARYFEDCAKVTSEPPGDGFLLRIYADTEHYWNQLTPELKGTAETLISRVLSVSAKLAKSAQLAPLTGPEDIRDIKVAAKTMRAALRLRHFQYRELDVLHDEGSVLGLRPAEQSETGGIPPDQAQSQFLDSLHQIGSVLKLVEAVEPEDMRSGVSTVSDGAKYRAGTAFIMMWMDPKKPELVDVADAIRAVFRSFGIRAIRADDIEHEGLISERVLNEIRTAEFLFADLTGTRPNVYYEVGFAHALGKRVILYRRAGTDLHFDLAGYNCPGYENMRDLKEKLTRRLVEITNRNPTPEQGI